MTVPGYAYRLPVQGPDLLTDTGFLLMISDPAPGESVYISYQRKSVVKVVTLSLLSVTFSKRV